VIPPGGEGEIKAVLRTKGRSGKTKKRITVMSNDPVNPNLSLELVGEIVVDVSVKPRHLSFGQIGKGETVTREFELTVNEPEKVKITEVTVSDERFVLQRISGEASGNSKYSVKLTNTKTIGRVSGQVIIKLEGSESEKVEVPVRASVVGDLRYSRSVYFNKRDGEFPEREIVFTRRSGKPVHIKKAEDPEGHLKLEIKVANDKKAIVVATVAKPENDYSKPLRNALKIHVADKDEPVVELRYTITDRPRPKMPNVGKRTNRLGAPIQPLKADIKSDAKPKSAAEVQ
jgi:hypothetical protein